jgi:hypothetical protein
LSLNALRAFLAVAVLDVGNQLICLQKNINEIKRLKRGLYVSPSDDLNLNSGDIRSSAGRVLPLNAHLNHRLEIAFELIRALNNHL